MPQPPSPGGAGGSSRAEPDTMSMIVPRPRSSMWGSTAWISSTWCTKLPVNMFEHRLGREVGDLVEGADALVDRVVEEHVDAAPLLEHGGGQRQHGVAVEQVHRHDQGAPAALLDLLGGALEAARHDDGAAILAHGGGVGRAVALLDGAGADDDVEAGLGQRERAGAADAAARAGDDGDGCVGHGCPLSESSLVSVAVFPRDCARGSEHHTFLS